MPDTQDELRDFIEHLERYRAVTLQVLDIVDEADLAWRPGPGHYSLGQQLVHIALTEDMYGHGLFEGDWDFQRARFPAPFPDIAALRVLFIDARQDTLRRLDALDPAALGRVVDIPGSPLRHTLRSWLWFILEHELHHKGQIWTYLRMMGHTAPFYAMPLPLGERPDVQAREDLGGF